MKNTKYSKVFALEDGIEILIQLAYADEEDSDSGIRAQSLVDSNEQISIKPPQKALRFEY